MTCDNGYKEVVELFSEYGAEPGSRGGARGAGTGETNNRK